MPEPDRVHAEFTLQTLLYVARLAAAEDYPIALSLGLRPAQIERIRAMPLDSLHELALSVPAHLMTIAFDPAAVDLALTILDRRRGERQLILDLIRAGAPYPLLHERFGMRGHDYAAARKLLGLADQGAGRPPKPAFDRQQAVWRSWEAHADLADGPRYLAVHRDTDLDIRIIHALVREWATTGDTPVEVDPVQGRTAPPRSAHTRAA